MNRGRLSVGSRCKACEAGPARERSKRWHAVNREGANVRRRQRWRRLNPFPVPVCVDCGAFLSYSGNGRPPKRCEPCKKGLRAQRSQTSYEAHREERAIYFRARKAEQRAVLDTFKREAGCIDCGKNEGRLEFDHQVKKEKSFSVPHGLGCSWDTLWAEVAKCDVRCSRCHRLRHAAERRAA